MPLGRLRAQLPVVVFLLLVLLLVFCGVLLNRAIHGLAEADNRKERDFLQTAVQSLKGEFSGILLETVFHFHPLSTVSDEFAEADLIRFFREWRAHSPRGQMVKSLSLGKAEDDGTTFLRVDHQTLRLEAAEWPLSLAPFRQALRQLPEEAPLLSPPGFALVLEDGTPRIAIPVWDLDREEGVEDLPAVLPERAPLPVLKPLQVSVSPAAMAPETVPSASIIGWSFLELDVNFLTNTTLPELVNRHFGKFGLSRYLVAVVDSNTGAQIYESESDWNSLGAATPDARVQLFGPEAPPPASRPAGSENPPSASLVSHENQAIDPEPLMRLAWSGGLMRGGDWILMSRHRAGSISTAVANLKHRNRIVGFGLLFLLAASMGLLLATTFKSQSLARKQMEFVAGVSHELHTPLSVIQSAGFNLASGLIERPDRHREYGQVIQRESRRLSRMIQQILSYAGIESASHRYVREPILIEEFLSELLEDYSHVFSEENWHFELDCQENLPPVSADRQALESVLRNVIENALKYASDAKWLGIKVRGPLLKRRKKEVQITIQDRGPGIPPEDLPHIFEPFFRGKSRFASAIPGSGLGLCLVERHLRANGGRVSVKTSQKTGTAFLLHLPAAPRMGWQDFSLNDESAAC